MVVGRGHKQTLNNFMLPLINLGEMKEATDAMLYACMINEYVPTTSSIHSMCAERSHGVFWSAIKKTGLEPYTTSFMHIHVARFNNQGMT